jgi:hypothetical protein
MPLLVVRIVQWEVFCTNGKQLQYASVLTMSLLTTQDYDPVEDSDRLIHNSALLHNVRGF